MMIAHAIYLIGIVVVLLMLLAMPSSIEKQPVRAYKVLWHDMTSHESSTRVVALKGIAQLVGIAVLWPLFPLVVIWLGLEIRSQLKNG